MLIPLRSARTPRERHGGLVTWPRFRRKLVREHRPFLRRAGASGKQRVHPRAVSNFGLGPNYRALALT